MRLRYVLLCVHVVHVSLCYGMERYFEKFVDIVSQIPQQLVARIRHEDRLLEKPAISPLPQFIPELLNRIASNLDGQAMAHFASCCSSVNQTLNASHYWMRNWHQDDMHAPLKIAKEYVVHNEALMEKYATSAPEQLQTPECKNLVEHPLTDFNYLRVQKSHWDNIVFCTQSYVIKPEQYTMDDDDKKCLHAGWGPRKLVINNMVHILCARAQHPECVKYLLDQRADANCVLSNSESPIQGAINAFTSEKLFVGNAGRCISMINILLDHQADIHYKKVDGSNYVHRVSICQDGHLLLPCFIKQGSNLNERNDMGNTPLLVLAECARDILLISEEYSEESRPGFLESIRLLTEAKADTTVQNNKNESLFDLLPPRLHQEVQAIIDKKIEDQQ
jgi:hypothetical protein